MTDDPLGWARERVTLIDRLFDSLETRVVAPGQGYGRLRTAFTDLLSDRWYALLVSTKYLGGATTARDHRGDPDARPAISTVPADRQREALAFIAEAGFGEQAFSFRPELLSLLAPGALDALGRLTRGDRDGPTSRSTTGRSPSRARCSNQLLDPVVLSRIRDAELRAAPGDADARHPRAVRDADRGRSGPSWGSAPAADRARPRNTGSVRRDIQRLHLNAMVRMVVASGPGNARGCPRAGARYAVGSGARRLAHALDGRSCRPRRLHPRPLR